MTVEHRCLQEVSIETSSFKKLASDGVMGGYFIILSRNYLQNWCIYTLRNICKKGYKYKSYLVIDVYYLLGNILTIINIIFVFLIIINWYLNSILNGRMLNESNLKNSQLLQMINQKLIIIKGHNSFYYTITTIEGL